MAKTYTIRALETGMVDYLGVFTKGEERELTTDEVKFYEASRGVPMLPENLPDMVELTVSGEDDAPSDPVVEAAKSDKSFPEKEA
jgi:hypothetical protein